MRGCVHASGAVGPDTLLPGYFVRDSGSGKGVNDAENVEAVRCKCARHTHYTTHTQTHTHTHTHTHVYSYIHIYINNTGRQNVGTSKIGQMALAQGKIDLVQRQKRRSGFRVEPECSASWCWCLCTHVRHTPCSSFFLGFQSLT